MNQDPITNRQFTILVVMYTTGSSILLIPAALSAYAKQDAWLSSILGVCIGLSIILLLKKVMQRVQHTDFFSWIEHVLGKWLGKLVILGYVFFGAILAVVLLRYNGDFIDTQMMPDTPIEIILMMMMMLVIIALTFGIGTVARTAELLFPWATLLLLMIIILVIPQFKFTFIQPVYENGILPILHGSQVIVGIPYLEFCLMIVIAQHLRVPEKAGRALLFGGLIGGIVLIMVTLVSILALGPHLSAIHLYPSFTLTKKINIGNFLQRIEAFLAVVWFLTIFFKFTLVYYTTVLGVAKLFGLRSHRSLLWPLGLFCFTYSLVIYPNVMYGIHFAGNYWTIFAAIFGLLLPLLLLVVSHFRKLPIQDTGSSS